MITERILLESMFGTAIDWDRFIVVEMKTVQNEIKSPKGMPVYDDRLLVYIEEKNIIPEELKCKGDLISHGFYDEEKIHDFPLRDKAVTLIVKKRRWKVKSSGEIVSSNLEIRFPETKSTKTLLNFLK